MNNLIMQNDLRYRLLVIVILTFSLSLQRQIGTTSSCSIPQVLTEARVGSRSGAILDLPFFILRLQHKFQSHEILY